MMQHARDYDGIILKVIVNLMASIGETPDWRANVLGDGGCKWVIGKPPTGGQQTIMVFVGDCFSKPIRTESVDFNNVSARLWSKD